MIELKPYEPKYNDALLSFYLDNEDIKYTALPKDALTSALENPNKQAIVILKDDQPAGFFVLHQGDEIRDYIDPEDTMLIRALSIDSKFHRQGIGTSAMRLVSAYVKNNHPTIKRLALAVNMKNTKAAALYLKAGYKESHRRMGIKGEQRILTKTVMFLGDL